MEIGSGRRVIDGDVSHNEATREDGEDVTAVFAVGGDSSQEAIHCGLTSSAHTSAMSNSAPGLKKHIMPQRNCFGAGKATHGVVRMWRGRAGSAVTRNRRGARGHMVLQCSRYIERWIKWTRVELTGKLSWTKSNQKPK
jgi:hypothetical protein